MILKECYETILNAVQNFTPPQLPEGDTLGHLSYLLTVGSILELYRVLVMEIVCLIWFPYLNLEMRMLQIFFNWWSSRVIFKCTNIWKYSALLNASVALQRKPEHIFPDILAIDDGQNSWYRSFDQKTAVKREALAVAQKGASSSLLSVLGLSSVMKQPIRATYPNVP